MLLGQPRKNLQSPILGNGSVNGVNLKKKIPKQNLHQRLQSFTCKAHQCCGTCKHPFAVNWIYQFALIVLHVSSTWLDSSPVSNDCVPSIHISARNCTFLVNARELCDFTICLNRHIGTRNGIRINLKTLQQTSLTF